MTKAKCSTRQSTLKITARRITEHASGQIAGYRGQCKPEHNKFQAGQTLKVIIWHQADFSYSVLQAGVARLDFDVTEGYGPETITVSGFVKGKYIVRAKHFGGQHDSVDKSNHDVLLETSKAIITMYEGSKTRQYELGMYGYLSGIYWHILAIDGETRKITQCTPSVCSPVGLFE